MKKRIGLLFIVFISMVSFSQEKIKGMIMVKDTQDNVSGLEGVSVYWLGTALGTVTNKKGWFQLPYQKEHTQLVVSYVGRNTDTLTVKSSKTIHHFLKESNSLEEVFLGTRKKSFFKSYLKPINSTEIREAELLKAACCNLSESFETNPSVDVNYTDAVSGNKQIKMLGLRSPYLLITQENIPTVRGASQVYGMSYVPGTWIESIQITKGMGSVVNGFESIAGQINVELQKPSKSAPLYLNMYGSGTGRYELNAHVSRQLSQNWSSGVFLHGNKRARAIDRNRDSFLEVPRSQQINLLNRWQYANLNTGWVHFFDISYLKDRKQSGQVGYDFNRPQWEQDLYGIQLETERVAAFTKTGYVFKDKPYQSFGIQSAYSNHFQKSFFGNKKYDIAHESFYLNSIFQSVLGSTRHKFKTGVSLTYDRYDEHVMLQNYQRNEKSIGGFFEYTYDSLEALILVAGLRVDHHNLLGDFLTPRLHVRYEAWDRGVFKFSLGSGRRASNIFTEYQKIFASARTFEIENFDGPIYGLQPEKAWNYGLSYLQEIELLGKKIDFSMDFFRTDFKKQVVVDYDNSPQKVLFYNLEGASRADAIQLEADFELFPRFDVRFAYKYYDVRMSYKKGLREVPLQVKNRWFSTMSYQTLQNKKGKQWKLDATINWLGTQRLPDTKDNPLEFQLTKNAPAYSLLNAQITRAFSGKFEIYMGGENLGNTTQKNPILGSDRPFGDYFDTTIVYAPVVGRMFYGGLRYKL